MRHPSIRQVVAASAVLACVFGSVAALAQEKKPEPAPDPAKLRENLVIADDVWKLVLAGTDRGAPGAMRPIGFTSDEMRLYGGRDHLIRGIENLFRDVRVIPRETGRITDDLLTLGRAGNVGELVQRCCALTDLPSGRMYVGPTGDEWGIEGVAKGASAADAARAVWEKSPHGSSQDLATLVALPEPVVRFVVRLCVAQIAADPWLRRAAPNVSASTQTLTVRSLSAPWWDEANDQSATLNGTAFTMLREYDRAPGAYGSVVVMTQVTNAIAELRPWLERGGRDELSRLKFDGVRLGAVRVSGVGDDVHDESDGIVVDLGGNDRWSGSSGGAVPSGAALSLAIDLGGDDLWGDDGSENAIGFGVFGLGAVIDLAGNDRYTVKNDGLGRGLFGVGVLWDVSGNDTYVVKTKWAQGVAHAGVGLLLDQAGDDTYECAEQSQGMGSTLGCGLLLDLAGNDSYVCRDDGNVSALYLNQSVAMAQGCGYGRRADIGDGRSLAGGWGLLVDGGGNDRYHAQVWSQGCGYWWGVGVLEDRDGDDVYENGKYSSGAGAHYAIGVHVDLDGNDRYNQGVTGTKNQFQAHARDGSIGVFVDGGGNDVYAFRPNCAGSSDLASIGLFWDRSGDDTYAFMPDPLPADGTTPVLDWPRPPFGTATIYRTPQRSFRDDLPSIGIFLDTGGTDTYPAPVTGSEHPAKNNASWAEHPWPNAWGFGLDR